MATEIHTSDDGGNSGNTLLAFLVGGVLMAVALVGFLMWDNYKSHTGGAAPAAVVKVEKK